MQVKDVHQDIIHPYCLKIQWQWTVLENSRKHVIVIGEIKLMDGRSQTHVLIELPVVYRHLEHWHHHDFGTTILKIVFVSLLVPTFVCWRRYMEAFNVMTTILTRKSQETLLYTWFSLWIGILILTVIFLTYFNENHLSRTWSSRIRIILFLFTS